MTILLKELVNLQGTLELIKLGHTDNPLLICDINQVYLIKQLSTVLKDKAILSEEITNATPVHTYVIKKQDSLTADMENSSKCVDSRPNQSQCFC